MIDSKKLTHELIDCLTSHGGFNGLSFQQCQARVDKVLKDHELCVCGDPLEDDEREVEKLDPEPKEEPKAKPARKTITK